MSAFLSLSKFGSTLFSPVLAFAIVLIHLFLAMLKMLNALSISCKII